jgi:hypothetical protein
MTPAGLAAVRAHVAGRHRRRIVACGSGFSTLVLARLLHTRGGRLVSLEHDQTWATRVRSNLAATGLAEIAQVALAPLKPHPLARRPAVVRGTRASPRTGLTPAGRSELAARLRHLDLPRFMAPEQSGRTPPKGNGYSSVRSRRPLRALRSDGRDRREDPRRRRWGLASASGDGCARRPGSAARESQLAAGVEARPLLERLSGEEYRASSSWPCVQDVSLNPEGRRSALAPRRGAQGQRLRRAGPAIRPLGLFPLCPSRDTPERARTP